MTSRASRTHTHAHKPDYVHVSYLTTIQIPKLRETVRWASKQLRPYNFDAIAFRGLSGALIAPAIAMRLNKTLIAVRKPIEISGNRDATHSPHLVEGDRAAKTYVIVDDLVSSGRTVLAIVRAIKEFAPHAVCAGILQTSDAWREDGRLAAPPTRDELEAENSYYTIMDYLSPDSLPITEVDFHD